MIFLELSDVEKYKIKGNTQAKTTKKKRLLFNASKKLTSLNRNAKQQKANDANKIPKNEKSLNNVE